MDRVELEAWSEGGGCVGGARMNGRGSDLPASVGGVFEWMG